MASPLAHSYAYKINMDQIWWFDHTMRFFMVPLNLHSLLVKNSLFLKKSVCVCVLFSFLALVCFVISLYNACIIINFIALTTACSDTLFISASSFLYAGLQVSYIDY
jgi:hypothetical protein